MLRAQPEWQVEVSHRFACTDFAWTCATAFPAPPKSACVDVCACVFVVSIVLLMGGRKAPPPRLPIVARGDDDVMAGGLEVQGTMGNYLTQTYTHVQWFSEMIPLLLLLLFESKQSTSGGSRGWDCLHTGTLYCVSNTSQALCVRERKGWGRDKWIEASPLAWWMAGLIMVKCVSPRWVCRLLCQYPTSLSCLSF